MLPTSPLSSGCITRPPSAHWTRESSVGDPRGARQHHPEIPLQRHQPPEGRLRRQAGGADTLRVGTDRGRAGCLAGGKDAAFTRQLRGRARRLLGPRRYRRAGWRIESARCGSGRLLVGRDRGLLTLAVVPRVPGYHVPFDERTRREAGIAAMAVGLITRAASRRSSSASIATVG